MSCWCYKCNAPTWPSEDLKCPNCNDDYIEYENSIAPSEVMPRTMTVRMDFGDGPRPVEAILLPDLPEIVQRIFGGNDQEIGGWFGNIMRRFRNLVGDQAGGGRALGDFFLGTEEQLQDLAERLMRLNQQSLGSPPTDPAFVKQLQAVSYADGICGEDTCPICLDQFEAEQKVIILPCKHGFHVDCIEPWLKMHSECPCCRHKLPSS